jgi:hypothetical protein
MDSIAPDSEREKYLQENLLLLTYKVQQQRLEKVWQQFEAAGFKPILIKGWAAALKYPNPAERLSVDVDLVVEPEDFDKAQDFLNANQFDLAIDLHEGARHLDSVSFAGLFASSVTKPCGRASIRVLSEEDHLRILSVHWLTDGGGYKDRLWDIYHAVNNRSADFSWAKCLDSVSPKRKFWTVCAIGLAHQYLGLKTDDLPFRDEFKNIPRWVHRALEKEWADEVRLIPLQNYLHDKKNLWKQIKKRIPPNPITATILVGGAIDNTPRIFYQAANIFQRSIPSWQRIRQTLKSRRRKN